MGKILSKLSEKKLLVSDGAWGTFLQLKGLKQGEAPESWNLTHRKEVLDIAGSYIDAGADIIETNSFGGSKIKLEHFSMGNKVYEVNKAAAEISREAAGDNALVMGSIGPTGKFVMMGDVTKEELKAIFSEQAEALAAGGADGLIVETFYDLDEAEAAFDAAKSTSLDVICSFTFEKKGSGDYYTMMGHSIRECIEFCLSKGVDVIGTNCGNGYEAMIDIIREYRDSAGEIPLLVQANAGLPELRDSKLVYPETPEFVKSIVPKLIEAGATIIGGCCGTTPAHISAIKDVVDKYDFKKL